TQTCSRRRRRVPVVAVIAAARVPASVHGLVAAVVRGAVALNVVVLPAALLTTRPEQQHTVSLQFFCCACLQALCDRALSAREIRKWWMCTN
ncbi:MAG: hypothetical protein ACK559_34090, partial [bacterium]